jgi:hypothetical protein
MLPPVIQLQQVVGTCCQVLGGGPPGLHLQLPCAQCFGLQATHVLDTSRGVLQCEEATRVVPQFL